VLKSQMKELLEQERANAKDIAEVIEEERAKVEARTPITEEVRAGGMVLGSALRSNHYGCDDRVRLLATCIACCDAHAGTALQIILASRPYRLQPAARRCLLDV
jgi:acetylornithine/succinyldiaminopimelate/putrescine aminotransferase